MEVLPEITARTSIREFKNKAVDLEAITRILEAGRLAPSAKNRQPWRFIVILDEEKRGIFERACFGQEHVGAAPAIIACCSTNTEYRMPNGQLSYPIDISIAASFMMLQAVHEKLGTCLITTFDETLVREVLTVPFSMRVVLLLLIGHAGESGGSIRDRLALSRITSYDHW